MSGPTLISGRGLAARCSAQLLAAAGFPAALDAVGRRGVPVLLIGEATQKLIQDVFGREDLFGGLPRIGKRVVAWGQSEPVAVPHRAVWIPEEALVARFGPAPSEECPKPVWRILAGGPPEGSTERRFGTRMATATAVELQTGADPEACWIESLECGWLFLAGGWLLTVGDTALEESRMIRGLIAAVAEGGREFAAYPRVTDPLCGAGWLASGSAALAFDPLCGDGTGNAVREAILAAAVIRAAASGLDAEELLAHYRARLVAGFRKHLEICRGFYETGGDSAWWRQELAMIEDGLAWCEEQPRGGDRFQLRGWDLERRP